MGEKYVSEKKGGSLTPRLKRSISYNSRHLLEGKMLQFKKTLSHKKKYLYSWRRNPYSSVLKPRLVPSEQAIILQVNFTCQKNGEGADGSVWVV